MKKERSQEEITPTPLQVTVPFHIVRDLKQMHEQTGKKVDELVVTALKMFIATHQDYLGLRDPARRA